jgi:23S rRNA pseudouridine2605 synthase
MEKRVQKILAEMGVASRRKAEELIEEGRVTVNGRVAHLGQKADPLLSHIKLDGKLLAPRAEPKVYLALNKPRNVVTSLSDPEGRPTVKDYLRGVRGRVYPVGRLDFDSEGLLLMTNDGEFAHGVMHPSHKLPKTYRVKVKGVLTAEEFERLRKGVRIEDGMARAAQAKPLEKLKENSWLEITITEGRKRQIRRMLDRVGHPVIRLVRTRVGPVSLGPLKAGQLRPLTPEEVEKIKYRAGLTKEDA